MIDSLVVEGRPGSQPQHRILTLRGPLNLITVPGFLEVLRKETAPVLIVDFSGVTMLDSAGVGSLIQTFVSFQKSKRKMALVALTSRIKSVLELTRVQNLFPVYATPEEAESKLG